jgi:hypothetical protein
VEVLARHALQALLGDREIHVGARVERLAGAGQIYPRGERDATSGEWRTVVTQLEHRSNRQAAATRVPRDDGTLCTKPLVQQPPIIVRRVVDRGREGVLRTKFVSGN